MNTVKQSHCNTCYECAKIIKGKMVYSCPSILAIRLGDFEKAYHPKCFAKAQAEAEKEFENLKR